MPFSVSWYTLLDAIEDRNDIVHVIILLSIGTGFGTVFERFMIQFENAG